MVKDILGGLTENVRKIPGNEDYVPGSRMASLREVVRKEIYEAFEPSAVRLEDFPLLPAGILLTDSNRSSMVWYYDILDGKVKSYVPESKRRAD